MLQISSIEGNVFHDKRFEALKGGNCERIRISRTDLEKRRLRCTTDRGTDIGLILEYGERLKDGDVLTKDGMCILVEQMPEKVITIRPRSDSVETLVLLGHIIGNRHRPISIDGDLVSFPIQVESEIETFQRMFGDIINDIDITIEEKIFKPHSGAGAHEH